VAVPAGEGFNEGFAQVVQTIDAAGGHPLTPRGGHELPATALPPVRAVVLDAPELAQAHWSADESAGTIEEMTNELWA
jgi:hypothetical protein